MKYSTFLRTLLVLVPLVLIGGYFSPASAATQSIITNWQNPVPYSFYSYLSPVHVVGAYTLPPDWVGSIYVWQDGVEMPQVQLISNLGGLFPKAGAFDINLGIQPAIPSPHTINIEFFGGTSCFITNKCPGTSSNWTDESIIHRTYTAANGPDPVISVSYDVNGALPLADPAFNFSNTPVTTPNTRTLYVRNVGGGVAAGTALIAGGENPFYCVGGCPFSVAAGGPAVPIPVQYLPTTAGTVSTAVLTFNCTTPLCASVNANLTGNSVASVVPPSVSWSMPSRTFGVVNIGGTPAQRTLKLTNVGGGVAQGSLDFFYNNGFGKPPVAFSCVPNCDFNIPSGQSQNITLQFNPPLAGDYHSAFGALGSGGQKWAWGIDIYGTGNDKPKIDINCISCATPNYWEILSPVAIGATVYQTVEVRNVGVGSMDGALTPTPGSWNTSGWHCVSVTQMPSGVTTAFTDAAPCTFTGLVNGATMALVNMEFRGTPSNVGPQFDTVTFADTTMPSDKVILTLRAAVTIDSMLEIGGLFSDIVFDDTLVGKTSQKSITLKNLGPLPIKVKIALLAGAPAGTFACANVPQCTPAGITIPSAGSPGDTVTVTFDFTPPGPSSYQQSFSICLGSTCANYKFLGQGQAPNLDVHTTIPGPVGDTDAMIVCASQPTTCTFPTPGTRTVYFGDGVANTSGTYTNSVVCDTPVFGNPLPNAPKNCWISNSDNGTWITEPFKTKGTLTLRNDGVGGDVEWRVVSSPNFVCTPLANCSGVIHNLDGVSGSYWGSSTTPISPNIYFNPSVVGTVNQNVDIEYHYYAWKAGGTPTDCAGNTKWCNKISIPFRGTGLGGPHLTYTMGTFPVTNVFATTSANLTIFSVGTTTATEVSVSYIDGEFSCAANCGPYDIPSGQSKTAKIVFAPTSAGPKTGHFRISTVSGIPASMTVTVSGTGNAFPVLSILNPVGGSLDYGIVNIGSQRESGDGVLPPIIVTNTGAGLLTGDATLADTTHYRCISCHYEALATGVTQEVKVAFVPKTVSPPPLNNTLSFSGGTSAVSILLFGQGALGASSITSSDADFGRVVIRPGNFKEQVVTVLNQGTVDLPGGDITVTGPFTCTHPPTPYNSVTNKCSYPTIVAGGSVQFTIRFTPVAPGSASGVITLGGASNAKVRLSGTGVVPSVKFKEK